MPTVDLGRSGAASGWQLLSNVPNRPVNNALRNQAVRHKKIVNSRSLIQPDMYDLEMACRGAVMDYQPSVMRPAGLRGRLRRGDHRQGWRTQPDCLEGYGGRKTDRVGQHQRCQQCDPCAVRELPLGKIVYKTLHLGQRHGRNADDEVVAVLKPG
jgi:hypothetical protein